MPQDFDMTKAREFVRLTRRRKAIEEDLADVKRELEPLQRELQNEFAKTGLQRFTVDGFTVYLERKLWATYPEGEKPNAVAALKDAGLDDYVFETFDHNSVSALFREWDKADETPPPELEGRLTSREQFTVKAVRA